MMTLEEVQKFTENAKKKGSILGLTSMQRLLEVLSSMEGVDLFQTLPVIHIAGTNGKGSVGAFISQILQEAGYRVGRYVSPAVFDPYEVWTINGSSISQENYCYYMEEVKEACEILAKEGIYPTIFELETALAFLYFYREKVDYLLLEVGMGGAGDATNVIKKTICQVLTTISFDHMQFLGHTLEDIAKVKSGIIKRDSVTFSAPQKPEVEKVIRDKSKEMKSQLTIVLEEDLRLLEEKPGLLCFAYKEKKFTTTLAGHYQMRNAALAIEVCRFLLKEKPFDEAWAIIERGIANTSWPGRFQILRKKPLLIADGAHNEDAALELRKTLENCFTNHTITFIIGVLADKEHDKMLEILLPLAKKVYTITPDSPRALDAEKLAEEAAKYTSSVRACASLKEALEKTREEEITIACGSLSYLGQLSSELKKVMNS